MNENQKKSNAGLIIAIVIASIIVAILLVVSLIIIFSDKLKNETINNNDTSETTTIDENTTPSTNETNKDEKRVGTDEFGYITVPNNWVKFIDPDSPNTFQYSYANIYIATLYAVDSSQIDAKSYATNVMNKMKSENVENLTGATVSLGKYTAYQVYGHYNDIDTWLVCWFFEAEDNKVHYISIEGPDRYSEYFNIPNTFSLTK